ncbi:MAG: right-handed parallel beta-helix repeat-containing protein [Ilumatobacteraceae bacterium]
MTTRRWVGVLMAAALGLAACGGGDDSTSSASTAAATTATTAASTTAAPTTDAPTTTAAPPTTEAATPAGSGAIRVPEDQPTIQAAVDAAAEGDLILIAPGTYHEAVNVTTNNLTIRGLDRNEVVLDGQFEMETGSRDRGASGVAVENMTAMNYSKNGFFWTGVDGYRGSYLTAYRTGDYGIYVFDSINGLLEHSYGGGSPDAGIYIGECYPCNAVVDDVTSEHNGLGYSGTNSGGNLVIVNSVFRNNRAGMVPNSGSYELCYPERDTTIIGNAVYSNNETDTPAIDVAILAMGNGILVAGGVQNRIERNRVDDHNKTGIGLVPFLEEDPNDVEPSPDSWTRPCAETKNDPVPDPDTVPDAILWDAKQNSVVANVVTGSRVADIAVASLGDVAVLGNCFADNEAASSAPLDLEALAPCDGTGTGDWTAGLIDIGQWLVDAENAPPSVPYDKAVLPPVPVLDGMPDPETAPANPAVNMPPAVDLDAIGVPELPAS